MGDLEVMKTRFNQEIYKIKMKKGKNHQLFSRDEYFSFLTKVKVSKNKISHKSPEDYQKLSRYDTVEMGNVQKLIVPVKNEKDQIIYYTYLEEIFDIIHETHISTGHGGRNRMMKELKSKYNNITIEIVVVYLNMCEPCQKKMSIKKKGFVVKPIKSNEFNSRCQVDLIDMQSQADGEFKFIMVYQDHLTKFLQLRALKTKRAEEVAYHLLDVFTIFGAPCILHTDDNGREFANKVIEELCHMWNEPKIVHGKPRHSQSQGSIERANQDIEKMLSTWLETNKTTKWSEGLKFIQFKKNRAHHSGINQSPYEAIFGCKAKVGLKTFLPAFDTLSKITREEDLESILKQQYDNHPEHQSEDVAADSEQCLTIC
nr:KRAB-A domain-containing protein 2-like [Onthophagus taurus]